MKNLFLFCSFCLMLASCQTEESLSLPDDPDLMQDQLQRGTWFISEFMDDGRDISRRFNGVGFEFKENGVVEARSSTMLRVGSWRLFVDDGRPQIEKNFIEQSPWDELNEDWYIVRATSEEIILEDIDFGRVESRIVFRR
jgi:hypothetical protein